jgi:hypothetical protein
VEIVIERGEASADSLATQRARLACAADGPELAMQCTDVQQREPFTSEHGVEGRVFHLRHVTTRPPTDEVVEIGSRGPFFAFACPAPRPPTRSPCCSCVRP